MIWFTADTHFGHARINDLCDRGFSDVDEMNDAIVESFSEVKPDDVLFHLGDVALGGWKDTIQHVNRIAGSKVLIPGNHDRAHPMDKAHAREDVRESFQHVFESIWTNAGNTIPVFSSRDSAGDSWNQCVQVSHFPFADSYSERREDLIPWIPSHDGNSLGLLHGHVHNEWSVRMSQSGVPMINVGWDVWRRPISIEEVEAILLSPKEF